MITPSLPTFAIASAIMLPTVASELAEIVATCSIDLASEQGLESAFNPSTSLIAALSIPRFKSIGFIPAATAFKPSVSNA